MLTVHELSKKDGLAALLTRGEPRNTSSQLRMAVLRKAGLCVSTSGAGQR
jgi:hypothetical protein